MKEKGKKKKSVYKKEKEMQSHSWRGQPSVQLNSPTV
jgi:hypothetical protein